MKTEEIKKRMGWIYPEAYTIIYRDKIKPYVRTTKGSLWNDASQAYATSKEALALVARNAMQLADLKPFPSKSPLWLSIDYEVVSHLHISDADNILKAVADALQGVVYPDDRYIDRMTINRWKGHQHKAIITIGQMPGGTK